MGDIHPLNSRYDIPSGYWTPCTKLAPDSLLMNMLALKAWFGIGFTQNERDEDTYQKRDSVFLGHKICFL